MKYCENPTLQDTVYGEKCIDDRCPFISTIPILIRSGKITAVENNDEYYNRVGCQPTHVENEGYMQGASGSGCSSTGSTGVTYDTDTVPRNSFHHGHSKRYRLRAHTRQDQDQDIHTYTLSSQQTAGESKSESESESRSESESESRSESRSKSESESRSKSRSESRIDER